MENVFSKKDYNSDNGMITYIWGPLLWHYLHILSFNYPVDPEEYNKEKKHNKGFIQNCYYCFIILLQYTLPCGACRDNLKKNLNELNFKQNKSRIMRNRRSFSQFIYDLHENVNTMLEKKSNLTYNDVRDFYEHFRATCPKKTTKHSGCTNLKHGTSVRPKPGVCILFKNKDKITKTTKIHSSCNIKCKYTNKCKKK